MPVPPLNDPTCWRLKRRHDRRRIPDTFLVVVHVGGTMMAGNDLRDMDSETPKF